MRPPNGPAPPAEKYTFSRPTDVAWDPQGNIFVSDGYGNNRVVKYDKNGRFLKQVGSEKAGNGKDQFNLPHGIAVDAKGNVYVADRSNHRMQVLDNDLKPKAIYDNIGDSWTVCVSPGAAPVSVYVELESEARCGRPRSGYQLAGTVHRAAEARVTCSPYPSAAFTCSPNASAAASAVSRKWSPRICVSLPR